MTAVKNETGLSWSAVHRAFRSGNATLDTAERCSAAIYKLTGSRVPAMHFMRKVK